MLVGVKHQMEMFFMNKTQMEIAEEIGISQAQVSRLEKQILNKIREKETVKQNAPGFCR